MKSRLNVNEWVALFEEVGLGQAERERWHKLFETRHPAAHQGFLEWLELKPAPLAWHPTGRSDSHPTLESRGAGS